MIKAIGVAPASHAAWNTARRRLTLAGISASAYFIDNMRCSDLIGDFSSLSVYVRVS